jgi:hypothetical protein
MENLTILQNDQVEPQKRPIEPQPNSPTEAKAPTEPIMPTEPQAEVKKGRGRPKGSTKKTAEKKTLFDDLSEYNAGGEAKADVPSASGGPLDPLAPPASPPVNPMISGYLFLCVLDFVAPHAIIFIFGFFDPRYKEIKASKLQMTGEEKKELEPIADEVAKMYFTNVSPVAALAITAGSLYVGKLLALNLPEKK